MNGPLLSQYAYETLCDLAAAKLREVSESDEWLLEAAQRCQTRIRINPDQPGDMTFLVDLMSSQGPVRLVDVRADELLGADKAADEARLTLLQVGVGIPDDLSGLI